MYTPWMHSRTHTCTHTCTTHAHTQTYTHAHTHSPNIKKGAGPLKYIRIFQHPRHDFWRHLYTIQSKHSHFIKTLHRQIGNNLPVYCSTHKSAWKCYTSTSYHYTDWHHFTHSNYQCSSYSLTEMKWCLQAWKEGQVAFPPHQRLEWAALMVLIAAQVAHPPLQN